MKYIPYQLLFALFIFWGSSYAQILEPVNWHFDSEEIAENEYLLKFTAKIDKGWYVYSQHIEPNGPIPTSITFEQNFGAELQGDVAEDGEIVKEGFDKMFEMDVKKYGKRAVFSQKVKIQKDAVISGFVEFMCCDDEKCLPPDTRDFEFKLKYKKTGSDDDASGSIEPNESESEIAQDSDLGGTDAQPNDPISQILDPVSWSARVEKHIDGTSQVSFEASIDEGWYVYSQFIEGDGPIATAFNYDDSSAIKMHGGFNEAGLYMKEGFDKVFEMNLKKYAKAVVFSQKLSNQEKPIKGYLTYMTCDDTRCLPPADVDFKIDLKNSRVVLGDEASDEELATGNTSVITAPKTDPPVKNCGAPAPTDDGATKSLLTIFILGFGGGLLALLTPCVFPMIPLTVSFFTKNGQSRSKGFRDALVYGFCIVLIYFILALPFLIFNLEANLLNQISTSVGLNLAFFVIFVVFAISFFGYFEIALPSNWATKVDSASDIGGLAGIFFMALTLAIVSFSCTGPILGSLLVGALAVPGGQINLVAGMTGFGLALALPFTVFAAFPNLLNNLPKSGGWLNSIKVNLAFVELALALKFLSNADLVVHWGILKREIFLGAWILIGLGIVLYNLGLIKFPHDSKKTKLNFPRVATSAFAAAFVIYLIPGLWGSNLKLLSGFPPPLFYSLVPTETECPLNMECFHDYDKGIAHARVANKPVMIDFTGWACVNCRKMEENVWVQSQVFNKLSDEYVLISLYVDDKEPLPQEEQYVSEVSGKKIRTIGNKWADFQASNFQNNSQPYYVLLSPEGQKLTPPIGYTPDADDYLKFLDCGLDAFEEVKQFAELN